MQNRSSGRLPNGVRRGSAARERLDGTPAAASVTMLNRRQDGDGPAVETAQPGPPSLGERSDTPGRFTTVARVGDWKPQGRVSGWSHIKTWGAQLRLLIGGKAGVRCALTSSAHL